MVVYESKKFLLLASFKALISGIYDSLFTKSIGF